MVAKREAHWLPRRVIGRLGRACVSVRTVLSLRPSRGPCHIRAGRGEVPKKDDDDDSLIACDPLGSWRYYIQSFPVHRPPRPLTVRRWPVVTPPAPAWPVPLVKSRERKKERKKGNRKDRIEKVPRKFSSPLVSYSPSNSSSASVGPGGSSRGPSLAPTSVARKKSRIDLVHR